MGLMGPQGFTTCTHTGALSMHEYIHVYVCISIYIYIYIYF